MADMSQTLLCGFFTSNGKTATIKFPCGVEWLSIKNLTVAAANQTTAVPVEWFWQSGMPNAAGWSYWKSNAANAANLSQYNLTNGFTYVDSSLQVPGNAVAVTSTSTANPFVVATGSTAGLSIGSVVRLSSVAGIQYVNGFDFEIGAITSNTNFTPAAAFGGLVGGVFVAGGAGFYRVVPFNPIYYPSNRTVINITQATSAVVTVSVTHKYVVGQVVSFRVQAPFGMVQMDQLFGTITAVTQFTFTVNIDTTGFTAFTWKNSCDCCNISGSSTSW